MKNQFNNNKKGLVTKLWMLAITLITSFNSYAQDGNSGIQEATNKVKGYFDSGCDLMYAIGAVVGIIGAVKVLCAMNGLAA